MTSLGYYLQGCVNTSSSAQITLFLDACSSTSIAAVNLCCDLKPSTERLPARGTVKAFPQQDSPLPKFIRYKNIKCWYRKWIWDLDAENYRNVWKVLGQPPKWKPNDESQTWKILPCRWFLWNPFNSSWDSPSCYPSSQKIGIEILPPETRGDSQSSTGTGPRHGHVQHPGQEVLDCKMLFLVFGAKLRN